MRHQVVVFDAADVSAESAFWAGVLGGTIDAEDGHTVMGDGEPRVGVQLAPDHVPPGSPDGVPRQIHLDLWVDDIGAAHAEVVSRRAKLLETANDARTHLTISSCTRTPRGTRSASAG
jgi:hypothetical protein